MRPFGEYPATLSRPRFPWMAYVRAEFLKIWAHRVPHISAMMIGGFTVVIVWMSYHFGRSKRIPGRGGVAQHLLRLPHLTVLVAADRNDESASGQFEHVFRLPGQSIWDDSSAHAENPG